MFSDVLVPFSSVSSFYGSSLVMTLIIVICDL